MKLELDILNIKDVRFAEKTAISDGVLYINHQEFKDLLEKDKRFSRIDIELIHPGENCRIIQVSDVIEPRTKMEGSGENFPGVLGRLKTAGEGRTRVLRGAAVVTIDYTSGARPMFIDMAGLGADMGIYAKLQNIVFLCHPADGLVRSDYQNAVKLAGLKVAVFLAETGLELPADEVEVYDLESLAEVGGEMEGLPRVTYIYQIHSLQQGIVANEPILYGDNVAKLLPTILHPNEVLDGAVIQGYRGCNQETYTVQNHPIVRELYRRHGKDLCFVGVIITLAYATEPDRERAAAMAANLARSVLGADGAILTKIGGGAPHIDMGQTCEACEELGVKTVVIVQDESHGESSDGALLFSTPAANAVVNVGSYDKLITMPAVERVIGGPLTFPGDIPAEGEIEVPVYLVTGGMSQIGASKPRVREV